MSVLVYVAVHSINCVYRFIFVMYRCIIVGLSLLVECMDQLCVLVTTFYMFNTRAILRWGHFFKAWSYLAYTNCPGKHTLIWFSDSYRN